jgi:hypothetical protein
MAALVTIATKPSGVGVPVACQSRRQLEKRCNANTICNMLHLRCNAHNMVPMTSHTLGFAVQPEDRPALDELVAYFGDGNRSAYLRATLRVMKSVMLADQLRELQAYGQQRTAQAGINPADIPAQVQDFLKSKRRTR